ncbi:MAG TPA: peptidoglycan-binding domain-containing protein [Terriglobales bacterium]|nr:peptidoglycan-binding domain-containing protein [Terriglobales bacterium]
MTRSITAAVLMLSVVTAYPALAQNLGEMPGSPSSSDVFGNMRHGFSVWAPNAKVREVQAVLRDKGYYAGALDGTLNPDFRRAIWHFQRDKRLPRTASLDRATLAALEMAATGSASPGGVNAFGAPAPAHRDGVEAP